MRLFLSLALYAALLCSACAPKQPASHLQAETADIAAPLSPDAALARFIGESLPGSSSSFSQTRLSHGPVVVTVGKAYTSALNQQCRQAQTVVQGQPRNLAACQQADGTWALAPDIFADGVL